MDIRNLEETFKFEDNHWWFLGRRRIICGLVNKFFRGAKDSFVLDAGCGTGVMLTDLEKFATPIGIDRSEVALDYAKNMRKGNVIRADVCSLPFKDSSFDLVTVMGVLYNEDVRDDAAAVREFFRVLKKDGIVIIDESAYGFLQSRYNISWGGVRRYTRPQLTKKAKDAGFLILKSSYWSVPMLMVYYMLVKLENLIKPKREYYRMRQVGGLINKILEKYLHLEARLLEYVDFPFGTMVFIVGKKI